MYSPARKILPPVGDCSSDSQHHAAPAAYHQPRRSVLRLPAIMAQTGLARSTIYLHIKQGSFPKPIQLGGNSVGWLTSDIDAWIDERVAARNESEARAA